MDFNLTEQQERIRKVASEFAEKELRPIAAEIDEKEIFPSEIVKKLGPLGLMGVTVPKEYGGAALDTICYVIAIEEISKACASTGVIMSVNNSLVCYPIQKFGTEAQKQKFLVPLAKGEKLGAFSLTEPNAGSDAAGQQTTAQLSGEHYILNGTKIFVTSGRDADIVLTFAMTDKTKGTKGISAFLVEKGTEGFSVGKIEEKLGIRASITAELVFENCKVPKENLLSKEGDGLKIALSALDCGRIGISAQALGIAQAAFEESVKYAKERVQFGKPISAFQAVQQMLVDMAAEIEAARMLVYKAAYAKDHQERYSKEAAMAKLYASEVAMRATLKAVQIHGGYGYTKDYIVERLVRDAKITEIYEGTSEIQRLVIGSALVS